MSDRSAEARSRLILASQSPRRRRLLADAGYVFEVIPSTVDESSLMFGDCDPASLAGHLARAKAEEVAQRHPEAWVLGADTLIDCGGEVLGKPRDVTHAEAMVRRVFATAHRVITGVALICRARAYAEVLAEVTVVHPRPLTEAAIQRHLAGGSWRGKAGAYAIQETGDAFVDHLDGSLSNVIGLPLERVARLLPDGVGQGPWESLA